MRENNKIVGNSVKLDSIYTDIYGQVRVIDFNGKLYPLYSGIRGGIKGYFIKKGGRQCYFDDKKDIERIDNYLKS